MICYHYATPILWIFSHDLPTLLYYSHITVLVATLLIGLFVYFNGRAFLLNRVLLALTLSFAGWVFINLIAWGSNDSSLSMTVWPFFGIFQALIAIFSIYLMHVFLFKNDLPFRLKLLLSVLILPVILIAHTNTAIKGFNLAWCDAFQYENKVALTYYTLLGCLAIIWILVASIVKYKKSDKLFRKQIVLMTVGIELFLIVFFFLTYIAALLASLQETSDSSLEFYAIFGMGIYMITIGLLSVRFKTFNFAASAATILTVTIVMLVASQLTFNTSTISRILTGITLLLTTLTGIILIRSVRKEVKQREQLQALTKQLEAANERLKELDKAKSEFVSIASHQLRSPLTAIRGYASMLAEGSFGQMPVKALESAKRIEESAKLMAMSIEDYLNVSRIESGNMKYNLSDFNLLEMTSNLCDDLRPEALKRNLILLFRSDIKSKGIVNADVGKTNQIIHNLINNSIKYTPKGSISVFVRDDVKTKRIYVDITDTGIGMSGETISKLFSKFSRADNANSVNTSGTGLGLYVALKMAEAMGGNISCKSEGDGKGSTFTFELPLAM